MNKTIKKLKPVGTKNNLKKNLTGNLILINLDLNESNKKELYQLFEYIDNLRLKYYDIRLIIEDRQYKHLIQTNNKICHFILLNEFKDIKKAPIIDFEKNIDNIRGMYLNILTTI